MAGPASDSGEDDADLRLAIALSLGQVGPGNEGNPVELSSDDDDEEKEEEEEEDDDLDRTPVYRGKARQGSHGRGRSSARGDAGEGPSAAAAAAAPAAAAPGSPRSDAARAAVSGPSLSSGLAGLDRRQMEEERLARLSAKRKASDSAQGQEHHRSKVLRTEPAPQRALAGQGRSHGGDAPIVRSASTSDRPNAKGLRFPQGVVKTTWAYGYPRSGDDIKIEEVLQKDDLQLAVLSSFQWDEEWLLTKIDIRKTKLILVAFASSREQVGYTCMHPSIPIASIHPSTPARPSPRLIFRFPGSKRR